MWFVVKLTPKKTRVTCINLPCINACKCVVSRAHMTACWFIYSLSISIIIVQPSIYSCVVLCIGICVSLNVITTRHLFSSMFALSYMCCAVLAYIQCIDEYTMCDAAHVHGSFTIASCHLAACRLVICMYVCIYVLIDVSSFS